jgi:hypothetical protein
MRFDANRSSLSVWSIGLLHDRLFSYFRNHVNRTFLLLSRLVKFSMPAYRSCICNSPNLTLYQPTIITTSEDLQTKIFTKRAPNF